MQPTSTECALNPPEQTRPPGRWHYPSIALLLSMAACLLWAYWPALSGMANRWASDPQYSHGFLVPAFSLVLLWARRDRLAKLSCKPSIWGVPLLAAGGALYLTGAYVYFDWLEAASLLLTIFGACFLWGGWQLARCAAPAIGFLAFMLPLPFFVETMLAGPLRRFATFASTYVLQTIGLPAVAEGNVILIEQAQIGIAEACSGLSILVTFFALTTGISMLIRRPWPDKVLLVFSAIPIAVVANVVRIVVTSILLCTVSSRAADIFFHDLAGWLTMPLALVLLWMELWYLDRLLVVRAPRRPVALDLSGGRQGRPAVSAKTSAEPAVARS